MKDYIICHLPQEAFPDPQPVGGSDVIIGTQVIDDLKLADDTLKIAHDQMKVNGLDVQFITEARAEILT